MKSMSIEEFKVLKNGYTKRGRKQFLGAKCLRHFMENGFEVSEIEPKDFEMNADSFIKSQASYITKVLSSQIKALNLEGFVEAHSIKGHVYLVRVDI